jgi:ubiquinone/menaquinone biosynthesis C-methylase UbiE
MAFNILQVGSLQKQKRQDISIKVLRKLLDSGFNCKLTLVGDGPNKPELVELTRLLKLEGEVDFAGYVAHDKISKYYKSCDLVLNPSVKETFSAVPLEALLQGRTSIITKNTGILEVVDGYCLTASSNPNDFYQKVIDYIKNRKAYDKQAILGKIWVTKNLTWDRYAEEFINIVTSDVPPSVYNEKYFDIHHEHPKTDALYKERQQRIKRGIDFLEIKPGDKILDLGCGNGEGAEKLVKMGAKVWGIDYSETAVSLAKLKKLKTSKFQTGRIGELPYKNKFFDKIICLDVFEHVYPEELEEALLEIKRVLKPGGKLVVATAPNSFYLGPVEWIAKKLTGVKSFESDEYHINIFSYFRFKKLFNKFGGKQYITVTNDGHNYFYSRIAKSKSISGRVKFAARVYDFIFENPVSEFIILHTPLKIFFAHDLWAVVVQ